MDSAKKKGLLYFSDDSVKVNTDKLSVCFIKLPSSFTDSSFDFHF